MNSKIDRQVATKRDLISQPMNRRYAVFCKGVLEGDINIDCYSTESGGRLGDYDDSTSAEETALAHPHPVVIRRKALYEAKFYDY